ncbi:MAG: c-type cytochrome [Rhodomicrobiaceae bacterium]
MMKLDGAIHHKAICGVPVIATNEETHVPKGKTLLAAAFFIALPAASAFAQDSGDAEAGEKAFRKCLACHKVGEGAKNGVGPILNGIVGRQAGQVEGFRYSNLNAAAGEAGLVWTEENIIEYLPDPNAFLKKFLTDAGEADKAKGSTRMTFRLKDEKERRDVTAYLKTFSQE